MGIDFDTELSSVKLEAGSFYFFVPQIELDEHEDVSILAATLAWNDSLFWTFGLALDSCESSLFQATSHLWPTTERCHTICLKSALSKLTVVEDKTVSMVYMNALLLGRSNFGADPVDLREAPSSCQFCLRLSQSIGIASNMLDHASKMDYLTHNLTNINAVWASLIIEEFSRLGLTYFCVAPGSRSSPLAIAASEHPLTTCVSCFDERSLAFHAVGYARGSHTPAVIITSSGTAVSNLLPAVVEASQDFVPLLLLTADRPPELHNAGANQAINQVNHFGSFVRFFSSLPAPNDQIPARMVLTTLDSAVHLATSSPYGPVHINCPFREPLDSSPKKWMLSSLKGLDMWMASAEPFTRYIPVLHSHAWKDTCGQMAEVIKIIKEANNGLLLIGAIHSEDEIWTALLLAKHLSLPVVADILSGLRLRKLLSSFPKSEQEFLFVDHLDHALLSDSVKDWVDVDVIVQIGSRITSKRVSQKLEECFPCYYIVVDEHPCRHDPSHVVTHRIQSTVVQFADILLKAQFSFGGSISGTYLQELNMTVAKEISFNIRVDCSLTEPHIAQLISKALSPDSALFIGNSMAIRDADMYGCNSVNHAPNVADWILSSEVPCHMIRVAGNRGASGIDGLLSTAVGFAVGCNKRVLCVIGDVSFLHDTNGLAILKQRTMRKPMTIIVINNHGGAIFSFLPIADRTEQRTLDQYFYTSHNISIHNLCLAHGVNHQRVNTKIELQDALLSPQNEDVDRVIEVESSIGANATFHSTLRSFACQAANHALSVLSRLSFPDTIPYESFTCKIHRMKYSLYRIQLRAPPTFSSMNYENPETYREGFILSLFLEDGSVGYGEVAPLDLSQEILLDIEDQLRFLLHIIAGARISYCLPMLKGSFSAWIWSALGIQPCSLFPSVRCGLEMAILNAIASRKGSGLLNILYPHVEKEVGINERSSSVQICALVDSNGTPAEVAYIARTLVEEGFTAIKLKVARRADPIQDAAVIRQVRDAVGQKIVLRVDANQNWTYEEAIQFGCLVKNCDLQYIEEPVQNENDIIKYCEETGLPVALDESIDNLKGNPLNMLMNYTHPGIVAVVIKPSVVGGFENTTLIAQWAQRLGKMAVVSSAFESSLGLSACILLSCYLDLQNADICRVLNRELVPSGAQGLGTYKWLKDDVTTDPLRICRNLCSGSVGASVADAAQLLLNFQINDNIIQRSFTGEQVRRYMLTLDSKKCFSSIKVQEVGQRTNENVIVFLHGFLGTGDEWIPIMKAISGSARCISLDLPGHGGSKMQNLDGKKDALEQDLSIKAVADVICNLIQQFTSGKVTLVGYSMGARISLYIAQRFADKVKGAVIISGSPGLKDAVARKMRMARDDSRAYTLVAHGLQLFVDSWYTGEMWKSLRSHPRFDQVIASRLLHDDVHILAKLLSDLSVGRQPPLWEDLKQCRTPLLFIVGERDEKFKKIAKEMCDEIGTTNMIYETVEIPDCGHAVHLENPLPVIRALRHFITKLKNAN
ncbi:protein PHYLLO, chloroplastic isoform X2 [Tripterygium wilfordii]|nr:protein PHYLLO, chloroplastic isoform X2 [Tripterygium wilfordii]XP_038694903.1 protein PHYLLO, chloroplastic isoform X2 [Tripterygium wilfordii]